MGNPHMLFVNIAVNDLPKSMAFFRALGFGFNKQFTDESAACLVLGDYNYFMLLTKPSFQRFTTKPLVDANAACEALFAISVDSRAAVDAMLTKAMNSGGRAAGETQDLGFMYSRSFQDLDGHIWEVLFMQPEFVQPVELV